jgi:hypothetical protein
LTKLVAGSPHPTQNLEFFSAFEVNGSILFSVFSNNHIFSNYVERMYIINCHSVPRQRLPLSTRLVEYVPLRMEWSEPYP